MLRDDQIFFMQPQIYELSRLVGYTCYKELKDYAWQRSKKGTTMFRPIAYICNDGMVFVFPGIKMISNFFCCFVFRGFKLYLKNIFIF